MDTVFWFAAPEIIKNHGDAPIFFVISAANQASTVKISMPREPLFTDTTIIVPANTVYIWNATSRKEIMENRGASASFTLEGSLYTKNTNCYNTKLNKAILIEASNPVSIYYQIGGGDQVNFKNGDFLTLKGGFALGREFHVPFANKWAYKAEDFYPPTVPTKAFIIVATEDNTTVDIETEQSMWDGTLVKNIVLQAGETYVVAQNVTYVKLFGIQHTFNAGTLFNVKKIISNKPISVILSNDSQSASGTFDAQADQLIPIDYLGQEYIVIKGRGTLTNMDKECVFITGTVDNTTVTFNGTVNLTVNKGQTDSRCFSNFATNPDYIHITSNQPVYCFQTSGVDNELGGAIIPPVDFCSGSNFAGFSRMPHLSNNPGQIRLNMNLLIRNSKVPASLNSFYFSIDGIDNSVLIHPDSFKIITGTKWYYQRISIPINIDNTQRFIIKNDLDVFHLGLLSGDLMSSRFGYLAGFNKLVTEAYLEGFEGQAEANICTQANYQLQASGGTNYKWTPTTYLSDPNIANPVLNINAPTSIEEEYKVDITSPCQIFPIVAKVMIKASGTPQPPTPVDVTICRGTKDSVMVTGVLGVTFELYSDAGLTDLLGSNTTGVFFPGVNTAVAGTHEFYAVQYLNASCKSTSVKVTLTVLTTAIPSLIITNPAPICAAGTANLTLPAVTVGSSGGPYTYFTDTLALNSLANPNNAAIGKYFIKAGAGFCTAVKPVIITQKTALTPPSTFVTSSATVCENNSYTFEIAPVVNAISYRWSYPGINIPAMDTTVNILLNFPLGVASSTLSVTAVDACGQTTPITMNIQVDKSSLAGTVSSAKVCRNTDATLVLDSRRGNVVKWQYFTTNWIDIVNIDTFILLSNVQNAYQYRTEVKNGVCPAIASQAGTISFDEIKYLASQKTDNSSCEVNDGFITINKDDSRTLQFRLGSGAWQSSNTFNGLAAGVYIPYMSLTNNTCITELPSVSIAAASAPVLSDVPVTPISNCGLSDAQIQITATGTGKSLIYSIDGVKWNSNAVFTNLAPGTYTPQVQYSDSTCKVLSTEEIIPAINQPELDVVNIKNPSLCGSADGQIDIILKNPTGFVYRSGTADPFSSNNIFSNLAAGSYVLYAANADGSCETLLQTEVLKPIDTLQYNAVQKTDNSSCELNDASITLSSNETRTLQYSILPGVWVNNPVFNNLAAAVYQPSIRLLAANACVTQLPSVSVSAPQAPVINNVEEREISTCGVSDGRIIITATGGSNNLLYSIDGVGWSSVFDFPTLSAGVYKPQVKFDNNTCLVQYRDVTIPSVPMISMPTILRKNITKCDHANGEIQIETSELDLLFSIDGGNTYSNQKVFTSLPAGTYDLVIKRTDNRCMINYPDGIVLIENCDTVLCPTSGSTLPYYTCNPTVDLYQTIFGFDYGGIFEPVNNSIVKLQGGTHTFRYRHPENSDCPEVYTNIIVLADSTAPLINICTDSLILKDSIGNGVRLAESYAPFATDECGIDSIYNDWNKLNSLEGEIFNNDQLITWTVKDRMGNISFCKTYVRLETILKDFDIPNLITPNDDGKYDEWEFSLPPEMTDAVVHVYDRWGKPVYKSNGSRMIKWNAQLNGKKLPSEGYYYLILKQDKVVRKGSVTIMW